MYEFNDSNSLATEASRFWVFIGTVREDVRREYFIAFAHNAVSQFHAGRVSRREVGAALAPGWNDKAISGTADMTVVTNLAGEMSHAGFETQSEADRTWDEMCETLARYW